MSILFLTVIDDKNEYIAIYRRYNIGRVITCKRGVNEIISSDC
jgi:hypothetical protein